MEMATAKGVSFNIPHLPPITFEPSAFERGVAEELKALAEQLESGALHITRFRLKVLDEGQELEISVR